MKRLLALSVLAILALAGACALRPVCRPLSDADVAQLDGPIAQRRDRDVYMDVFQQRHGQSHHCKTWISRQLFF